MVVGEGTRCWFGNQFSLIAPRFAAHGVELWVPELGGRYDPRNPSHKMLMGILGGMSESERQHVQARVRAAMDAQVVNEGRHQGGRAPYGYVVVDGGPHPNPRKAAEGYRLRVLAIDDAAAEVVRRIFVEKLDGAGDRAIAAGLNRDGVPCPQRDGLSRTAIGSPTAGRPAPFARSWIIRGTPATRSSAGGPKNEELFDPDDVAAGHVTRFRRAASCEDRAVAPPGTSGNCVGRRCSPRRRWCAGLEQQAAWRLGASSNAGRGPHRGPTLLRGRVRCGYCTRRMEGTPRENRVYYRCAARSIVPGAPVLATHPKNVYLPESAVVGPINAWIGSLFGPEHREGTVRRLLSADANSHDSARGAAAAKAVADAEALRRLQSAIEAGVDPAALVEPINRAQEELEAAQTEQRHAPSVQALGRAEVEAMIDYTRRRRQRSEEGRPRQPGEAVRVATTRGDLPPRGADRCGDHSTR